MWRSKRFPQITRTRFKRLMQGLDSQVEDLSQCEPMAEDETEICGQRDKSTCEAVKTTTDVNIAPDRGVTPKNDVVSSGDVLPSRNVVLNCNTVVDEKLSGDPLIPMVQTDKRRLHYRRWKIVLKVKDRTRNPLNLLRKILLVRTCMG